MIIYEKDTINSLANDAREMLGIFTPTIMTVADAENVYDVRIKLNIEKKRTPPYLIALSYDKDAGYFIDIDNVTWEFQDNKEQFKSEAIKLFDAVRNDKVKLVKKKILNFITIGYEAHITN